MNLSVILADPSSSLSVICLTGAYAALAIIAYAFASETVAHFAGARRLRRELDATRAEARSRAMALAAARERIGRLELEIWTADNATRRLKDRIEYLEHENTHLQTALDVFGAAVDPSEEELCRQMAEEFICWPLPESVCADPCATTRGAGRIGTNLLAWVEAKAMFEAIAAPKFAALRAQLTAPATRSATGAKTEAGR